MWNGRLWLCVYVCMCVCGGVLWPFPLLSHVLQLCRSISMQTAAAALHPIAHFKQQPNLSSHTHTQTHTLRHTHAHSDHVVQFIYHNSRRNSTLYMSMRCIHLTFNPRSQWHTHTVTNPHRGSTAHAHSLLLCRTSSAVQDVFLIFHFLPKVQIQTVWVQS